MIFVSDSLFMNLTFLELVPGDAQKNAKKKPYDKFCIVSGVIVSLSQYLTEIQNIGP